MEHCLALLNRDVQATPRDIEDIVTLGKDLHTCPYYGSRRAISQAQVSPSHKTCQCVALMPVFSQLVTLPYNLLLLKRSREALEIDLANQIVVIDEAHSE